MLGSSLIEFLGTALILFAVTTGNNLFVLSALGISIALGGKISGGHFNPAITFMKYLQGDITQTKAMYYVSSQYFASLVVFFLSSL
jgi:glycerol uptake facilitator-like aquaporin